MTSLDMIAQAKNGTGKTIVFTIAALEILSQKLTPQVIIVVPTREIALQIHTILVRIGQSIKCLFAHTFIGGTSIFQDIQNLSPCNVVIGTPGRLRQLIENGHLNTEHITLLIVDEADKIFENSALEETTMDIISFLPKNRQFLAFSATYTSEMLEKIKSMMNNPQSILIPQQKVTLKGVKQYWCINSPSNHQINDQKEKDESKVTVEIDDSEADVLQPHLNVSSFSWKTQKLIDLLSHLSFYQCIVFCNSTLHSKSIADRLESLGWPSAIISGQHRQKERNSVIARLRDFQLRVLVSTDLTARGLDVERINLVFNMDVPYNAETYLHRIGRAGRFGSYGIAINLVNEREKAQLLKFAMHYSFEIEELPENWSSQLNSEEYELKTEAHIKSLAEMEAKSAHYLEQKRLNSSHIDKGKLNKNDIEVTKAALIRRKERHQQKCIVPKQLRIKEEASSGLSTTRVSDNYLKLNQPIGHDQRLPSSPGYTSFVNQVKKKSRHQQWNEQSGPPMGWPQLYENKGHTNGHSNFKEFNLSFHAGPDNLYRNEESNETLWLQPPLPPPSQHLKRYDYHKYIKYIQDEYLPEIRQRFIKITQDEA